jgi:cobalamin biosynthesis protein CobT
MSKKVRSRRIRVFESAIERVARTLSKKWKIKVVFKHGECSTNGSTIYLPVLPDNADKTLMDATQGHLDHEAAHVVFSDFSVLTKYRRKPKTLTVINAMEDPRIEKRWCDMYPGARLNLRRSAEWSFEKVSEKREMEDPEDGQKKMMRPWDGLSDLGKLLYALGVYTGANFDDTHWFLKDVVEPDVMDLARKHADLFKQALDAEKTGDVVPLAIEFLERLQEEDEEVEVIDDPSEIDDDAIMLPPGASGSPQDRVMHKQPQADPNAPKAYEMEPMLDADPNQGQQDQSQQQQQQQQQQQKGGGQRQRFETDNEQLERDAQLTSRHDQLQDAVEQALTGDDRYLIFTTEGDELERIREGDRVRYHRFMQDAIRLVAPMKRKMARSMLATNVSKWEGDKTRGKVNPRRLYQVALGTNKRVFRQRIEAEDYNTCVLLMVDHSGSMYGGKLDLAAKTAIIFGELLNQLGIPFSVLGFSTGDGYEGETRQDGASAQERQLYTRWGNLWVGEYKSFDDPWNKAGPKMINMVDNGRANTYDGESLRYGAQVLLGRPEQRKILFWLNDGQPCPNWADDSQAHWQYACDVAKEVERIVELFAIGIRTDAVKRIYSNCVRVNAVEDIPKVCLSELDALIRKGKSYRGRKAG